MNKTLKKTAITLVSLAILILPNLVLAQGGFIPECGTYHECGYADLLTLVKNIITWVIYISVPISAGVFAYAGFLYMTTGVSDQKSKAKGMMWKVFLGLIFILASWLIVTTITNALLDNKFKPAVPLEGVH